MKKLRAKKPVEKVKDLTMTQLRTRPGSAIARVISGEVLVVTNNGKAVAVIIQPQ